MFTKMISITNNFEIKILTNTQLDFHTYSFVGNYEITLMSIATIRFIIMFEILYPKW